MQGVFVWDIDDGITASCRLLTFWPLLTERVHMASISVITVMATAGMPLVFASAVTS